MSHGGMADITIVTCGTNAIAWAIPPISLGIYCENSYWVEF